MINATWQHDTTWKEVHKIIGQIPDEMRGFYRGLYVTFAYAGQLKETYSLDIVDDDLNARFSPSGTIKHAEHFYSEPPALPPDIIEYKFNPVEFLSVAADLDAEAAINYIHVSRREESANFLSGYTFRYACTEAENGIPNDWPKVGDDTIWRNFGDFAGGGEAS